MREKNQVVLPLDLGICKNEEKTERSAILTIGKICVRLALQQTHPENGFGEMKFARCRTFAGQNLKKQLIKNETKEEFVATNSTS